MILYCAIFPALYFIGPEFKWFDRTAITYSALMYILVLNTLMLIGIGYCLTGCISYPYSNKYFRDSHFRNSNEKFSAEFIKCTERCVRIV